MTKTLFAKIIKNKIKICNPLSFITKTHTNSKLSHILLKPIHSFVWNVDYNNDDNIELLSIIIWRHFIPLFIHSFCYCCCLASIDRQINLFSIKHKHSHTHTHIMIIICWHTWNIPFLLCLCPLLSLLHSSTKQPRWWR